MRFDPGIRDRIDAICRVGGTPVQARSHSEVALFLEGFDVVEPGVVASTRWHPDDETRIRAEQPLYVGVARTN